MAKRTQLLLFVFILTGAFVIYAESASAQIPAGISDELLVFPPSGGSQETQTQEANPETTATYGAAFTPDSTSKYVILLESNEPPDPTETVISTPFGRLSDVVVWNNNSTTSGIGIEFLSDGNPQIQNVLQFLMPSNPNVSSITENGNFQDVTALLGLTGSGFQVQVASDVVPEPSTLLLCAGGLIGIAVRRRIRA